MSLPLFILRNDRRYIGDSGRIGYRSFCNILYHEVVKITETPDGLEVGATYEHFKYGHMRLKLIKIGTDFDKDECLVFDPHGREQRIMKSSLLEHYVRTDN